LQPKYSLPTATASQLTEHKYPQHKYSQKIMAQKLSTAIHQNLITAPTLYLPDFAIINYFLYSHFGIL
jgi:hypothetical protein